MKIRAIKTHKITPADKNIFSILDRYVVEIEENSILAVTSKIVAICQGDIVDKKSISKRDLVKRESQFYLAPETSKYGITLTIKDNFLIPTVGIDESNIENFYALWPRDIQRTANKIRSYLTKRFELKKVGVIVTDSKTTPLRLGTTGFALAHSGFLALKNYIGKPDLFGNDLHVTRANIADGLAAAAVTLMGEGSEQTPIAVINDLKFVKFVNRNPSKKELANLNIDIKDDLYGELIRNANWKPGGMLSPKSWFIHTCQIRGGGILWKGGGIAVENEVFHSDE